MRWLAIVLLCGCGSATTTEPHAPTTATEAPASPEAAVEAPVIAAPVALPRVEVPTPADLAAALTARLPLIEIVPQVCGRTTAAVSVMDDRVCLRDEVSGATRAMRRFATSSVPTVAAARYGDDVVFAVLDLESATTRYDGHVWRWNLHDDSYVGLAALSEDAGPYEPVLGLADFGVLIEDIARERIWIFDGELTQLRMPEIGVRELRVIDGHTYHVRFDRHRAELRTVRREGARLVVESVASFPYTSDLFVPFPEGRSLVVSAFPRRDTTSVYVVTPPATEVRELEVAVRRPHHARVVDGALELQTREGVSRVDLTTGEVTHASAWVETPSTAVSVPRSIYAVVPTATGVVLAMSEGGHELGPEGVREIEADAVPSGRTGCRCDDDALVCGETRIEAACTAVAELDRITVGYDDTSQRSTLYSPLYRLDRLEPDLVRVTRLADGARLWVRVYREGIFAQADDGAFVAPEGLAGMALRWGRSLLDAPVTDLVPHHDAFSRPTLITDFFSGRSLPTADTTLPH